MYHHRSSLTVLQAGQNSPGLAKLIAIQKDSNDRLQAIKPLIPLALQSSVQCGPLDEGVWCLLLTNNTTAAKMRQLLPALEAHLRSNQLPVKAIRLKVRQQEKPQGA
jgi:hypothetical protein